MSGMEKMKAVVGLGNPGPEYAGTRHNVGYRVAEEMAGRFRVRFSLRRFSSIIAEAEARKGEKIVLAKPLTFMNCSGEAVQGLMQFNRLNGRDILVVCDDLNLPLGQLRLRRKGSDGGHNGLGSIIVALGHGEFPRLRIGVGPRPAGDQTEFVLSEFSAGERPVIEEAVTRAADAVECWIFEGLSEAMNRFNRGPDDIYPNGEEKDSPHKGAKDG